MLSKPQKLPVLIIILNYNGLKFIDKCLEAVFATKRIDFQVVFVDNGSTDSSIQYAQEKYGHDKRIRFVQNDMNLGFAQGNNMGIKIANTSYIAFLNLDTKVDPRWLIESIGVLESDPSFGVCQSKLLSLVNPNVFDSAGDFIDRYGIMMRRGGDLQEKDVGQYDKIQEIFSARAAAMVVKKEVIDEVGLFDPAFFMTYEDIDFCWRARLRGYKIVLAPKSVVYHLGEAFTPTESKAFFTTRNWLISLTKNYENKTLLKLSPALFGLVIGILAAEIFLKKRPEHALRRIMGIFWIIKHFKEVYTQRLAVQKQIRRLPDSEIMKHMVKRNLAILHWVSLWRESS